MKLKDISDIHSGYISRGKIEGSADGNHFLLQAKNVDGVQLTYDTEKLLRFHPKIPPKDRILRRDDLLFMARGAHHFTVHLEALPQSTLAAACFFIVRITRAGILPGYVCWYLNQTPVQQYLFQHSGRSVHMPVVRRAVLENIHVPVPPVAIQTQVADMNELMMKEINLLQQLCKRRQELITTACLQSVRTH